MNIIIIPVHQSDSSISYDVALLNEDERVTFKTCRGRDDAYKFADKLQDAIESHCLEGVCIFDEVNS